MAFFLSDLRFLLERRWVVSEAWEVGSRVEDDQVVGLRGPSEGVDPTEESEESRLMP